MNSSVRSKELLMVEPTYFDIKYAINPFMRSENGELKKIDKPLARIQWQNLKRKFEDLGCHVNVLSPVDGLPDMVFSANQAFIFVDTKSLRPTALMGRMHSENRMPEVSYFETWFREQGYIIAHLNGDYSFEGNGDALLHPNQDIIWGGFGYRTDEKAYDEIRERWGFTIMTLELIKPEFYHLDTCFAILDEDTVAIQREAFSDESLKKIYKGFATVIEIDMAENLKCFSANCFSVGQGEVVLHKGSTHFVRSLEKHNFKVHEVDTSEFIKAGASVFCLKMVIAQK